MDKIKIGEEKNCGWFNPVMTVLIILTIILLIGFGVMTISKILGVI